MHRRRDLSSDFPGVRGPATAARPQDNCADEYKQAALAFRKTVLPDVDQDMMKEVLKMDVLRPDDFK